MSRRGSILIVHQIPSGTKRGGHAHTQGREQFPPLVIARLLVVMEGQEAIAGLA